MTEPNLILTKSEKNLIEYGGALGVALAATCLIQHFIFAIPSPVTKPMVPAYFFMILAFLFFAFQKHFSIILLIISGAFSLIIELVWLLHISFSLVVTMLFSYHLIVIITLFIEDIPKKLRMKRDAERAEKEMWAGKI
ncbi:MAG: hypothetical protein E6H09_19795 [Bacteroidetes bacterium]|jgi:predicted membrane protein|nr:MAG: hypothetical protein E6H09_19795 [Bacteroidota bacterium]